MAPARHKSLLNERQQFVQPFLRTAYVHVMMNCWPLPHLAWHLQQPATTQQVLHTTPFNLRLQRAGCAAALPPRQPMCVKPFTCQGPTPALYTCCPPCHPRGSLLPCPAQPAPACRTGLPVPQHTCATCSPSRPRAQLVPTEAGTCRHPLSCSCLPTGTCA